MKLVLLILFACPFCAYTQPLNEDSLFIKSIPPQYGTPIHMPETNYAPNFNYDQYTSPRKGVRVYKITSDSVYRSFFYNYVYTNDSLRKYQQKGADSITLSWRKKLHVDSIPTIDFTHFFLLNYSSCIKCLTICKHGSGNESCHRSACNFREAWFIGEKPRKLGWD